MPLPPELQFPLSPTEAAALIDVHEDTLKRWAAEGKVRAFRTPSGWWRFRREDLEQFIASGVNTPAPAAEG